VAEIHRALIAVYPKLMRICLYVQKPSVDWAIYKTFSWWRRRHFPRSHGAPPTKPKRPLLSQKRQDAMHVIDLAYECGLEFHDGVMLTVLANFLFDNPTNLDLILVTGLSFADEKLRRHSDVPNFVKTV
jgi:hypothetical protein